MINECLTTLGKNPSLAWSIVILLLGIIGLVVTPVSLLVLTHFEHKSRRSHNERLSVTYESILGVFTLLVMTLGVGFILGGVHAITHHQPNVRRVSQVMKTQPGDAQHGQDPTKNQPSYNSNDDKTIEQNVGEN